MPRTSSGRPAAEPVLVHRLQQVTGQLDRHIDRAAAAFRSQLDQALRRWHRTRVVQDIRTRTDDHGLLTGRPLTSTSLRPTLDRTGGAVINRALASLPIVHQLLQEGLQLTGLGTTVTASQRTAGNAVYRQARRDLTIALHRLASDTAHVVAHGQLSRQLAGEAVTETAELVDNAVGYLASRFDGVLATYAQALIGARRPADHSAAPKAFLYSGPIDNRCRKFCLRTVAKVWTRPTIDRMNNGITANTFLTRGGPNCRHTWWPVSDPSLVALADTGRPASGMLAGQAQRQLSLVSVAGQRRTA